MRHTSIVAFFLDDDVRFLLLLYRGIAMRLRRRQQKSDTAVSL
jgi:hypothetical protein